MLSGTVLFGARTFLTARLSTYETARSPGQLTRRFSTCVSGSKQACHFPHIHYLAVSLWCSMGGQVKTVLILGSAPNAVNAKQFDLSKVDAMIALNNAWSIRPDWTHSVYPEDFPPERRPTPTGDQSIVTYEDYVPANNKFGGIIYAGATMAFTSAYWALHVFEPHFLLFYGCDMVYDQPGGKSHFYGNGTADPLRDDPTLQSLEAKSNRLMALAAQEGCACINLSDLPTSRLTFPRSDSFLLESMLSTDHQKLLLQINRRIDERSLKEALALEEATALFHAGGDYWNSQLDVDAIKLRAIDELWLKAVSDQSDDVIS